MHAYTSKFSHSEESEYLDLLGSNIVLGKYCSYKANPGCFSNSDAVVALMGGTVYRCSDNKTYTIVKNVYVQLHNFPTQDLEYEQGKCRSLQEALQLEARDKRRLSEILIRHTLRRNIGFHIRDLE